MNRVQRQIGFLVIALALLASPACSAGGLNSGLDEKSTETPAGEAVQTAPTQLPLATLPPGTAGSDALDLLTGLDGLDSYRITYEMAVVGKDEKGNERQENFRQILEIVDSWDSLHFSMQIYHGDPTLPGSEPLEIFWIGPIPYMYMVTTVNGQLMSYCNIITSDEADLFMNQMLTPDELIVAIQRENLMAKGETVNGVITDLYNVKNADFGNGTASALSARVWVAQEDGFVVRLAGSADGKFSVTGPYLMGKMNWTYDLSQIDTLKEIVLPYSCRQLNVTT